MSRLDYRGRFGYRLSNGRWAYKGFHHRHWSRKFWSARWGCNCWFCPSACSWYYWCAPKLCYMPVSCIAVCPPVEGAEDPPDCEEVPEATEEEAPVGA